MSKLLRCSHTTEVLKLLIVILLFKSSRRKTCRDGSKEHLAHGSKMDLSFRDLVLCGIQSTECPRSTDNSKAELCCIFGLPSFPKAKQGAVHNSSLQTEKCIPSCDNMGRGLGEVRALQEGCEYSRNCSTEHLLFY